MKRLSAIFLIIICALLSASAVPAYHKWQQLKQPDGSYITARHLGDECYSYWENSEHQVIKKDSLGWWRVAGATPTVQQVAARRNASPLKSKPRRLGNEINLAPRGLVILVNFKDIKFKTYNKRVDFDSLLNAANYTKYGSRGSVRKYFADQSDSAYIPQFDVVGPVTIKNNYSYYGTDGTVYGQSVNDKLIGDFVIEAVRGADKLGVNWSLYDNNGDDEVDFIYLIYAGTNQAISDDDNTIWPMNFSMKSAVQYGMTSYSEYTYDYDWRTGKETYVLPTFGGKAINNFACSSEVGTENIRTGIGTICHEFSHVLGLPDYYDTSYGTNYQSGLTPGDWSLMDAGSHTDEGRTPPNYSIFDKYFMGWATPKILNSADDIEMTTAYGDGYQINSKGKLAAARSTEQQYYIENRQQTGWDEYLPWHGMIVWSVRYNSDDWSDNNLNNTANAPRCTVNSADMAEGGIGTNQDPYPGESSVTAYTPVVQYPMTEIIENVDNGIVTFKFMGGKIVEALDETNYDHASTHKVLRNGQVIIIRGGKEYNILGSRQ
ncbi:MAG: M6 family metalloprotease domain-containing protein [Paludibacteraceae bacterium]|nr:M6 family metalloprotease domain-containing protein [Paludibacteraceae bacterium]